MKPAGPERDKRIAELRSGELADPMSKCIARSLDRCPQEAKEEQCPGDCRLLKLNYKLYSTDISAAMELLPDHFEITVFKSDTFGFCACVTFYKEGPSWSGTRTKLAIFEGEYKSKKEWAIADAISGAWLKGGQK